MSERNKNGRGRPEKGLKGKADWFRWNVGERNEKYMKRLKGKFGQVRGYGILVILYELFLEEGGWELDLEDLDYYASEIGISQEELKEFIEFGIKKGIFQKDGNKIRCKKLEKSMDYLLKSRKRKKRYKKRKEKEEQQQQKQQKKNNNRIEKNSTEQYSTEKSLKNVTKPLNDVTKSLNDVKSKKDQNNCDVVDVENLKKLKDFLKTEHGINPNKKTNEFMNFFLANCPDNRPVEFTKFLIQSEFVKSKGTKAGGKVNGLSELVTNREEFNRLKDQYIKQEKTAEEKQQQKLAREKKAADRKQKSDQVIKKISNDPELEKQFKEEKYVQKYSNVRDASIKFAEDKGLL